MKKICMVITAMIIVSSCEIKVSNNEEIKKEHMKEKNENFPFPVENNFTEEYLVNNFWKCNYDTAGADKAYWVILPNYVKPTKLDPQPINGMDLTNIGIYNTIDENPYMEIWVAYSNVSNDIQPSEWLESILTKTGENILNKNEIITKSGEKFLDVLSSKNISENERVISRCAVLKNNQNYFVIKVTTNEKLYPELAQTIQHIATSWGLK